MDLLGFSSVNMDRLIQIWPELSTLRPDVSEQLSIEARYRSYLQRQDADIRAYRREEALELPIELDYTSIGSLSMEVCQKLATAKPATLAAASRIPGITPAALTALLGYVKTNYIR